MENTNGYVIEHVLLGLANLVKDDYELRGYLVFQKVEEKC